MKVITKNKLSKTSLGLIVLASLLALLIVAYVVISIVIGAMKAEEEKEKLDIREDIGESSYVGQPVAYNRITESQIVYMKVENENGTFDLMRYPNDKGEFWFGYTDPNGNETMLEYIPPIVSIENGFDYEELYAIENNDGYGRVYMLTYLCSAVGTLYFNNRIDLPTGTDAESLAKREELLDEYGFGEGESERVSFTYVIRDDKGNVLEEKTHHIQIGDKALSGTGRYFRVDGRDCIYYSGSSQIEYALMGFHSFVKGTLVAAGIPSDSSYGPLLATDFKHWVNQMHKEGEIVIDGANVVTSASVLTPIKESQDYTPEKYPDGYAVVEDKELKFDLTALKGSDEFKRVQNILVGKAVGECDDLFITLINDISEGGSMILTLPDDGDVTYTYEITAIESVITDTNEWHTVGTAVIDGAKIAVTYNYKIDGEAKNTIPCHAVIDLADPLLPTEAKEALLSLAVGELATPVEYSITYTADNTPSVYKAIVVKDIFRVYNSKGEVISVADDDSYVAVRYYREVNGVKGEVTSMTVSMKELKSNPNNEFAPLYDVLIGKSAAENVNITAYKNYTYYEMLRSYTLCQINKIDCFITSELIVSFRFQNGTDRDPFFGESVYENTTGGKYKLYGLENDVCNEILKRLGGLGEVSNEATGLSGTTVAVGLTHEVMEKYNLYDYTVYLELPRNISGSENGEYDFEWQYTLGFTLYVSREDPITGKRYVGSQMYDVVAEVDASYFDFLNFEFADLYARENMLLVHAENLDSFKVEFNMTDIYGEYDFDVERQQVYVGYYNDVYGVYQNYFEGAVEQTKYYVYVKESEGSMKTGLTEVQAKYPSDKVTGGYVSATVLYNTIMGKGEELFVGGGSLETLGVSYAFDAFQVMQNTYYTGTLTPEEQAAGLAGERIMRFSMKLEGENASAFTYVYDFYRVSDRKIMVSLYQADSTGKAVNTPVNDFYISTSAFKKMVSAYVSFLNAEEIDGEVAYPDEKRD